MASPYGKLFNRNELRGELQLLYQDKSLSQPPDQLIVTIDKDGLEPAFPEVYRALKLILTLPMTTASAERSFSCLKRMKNYLRSTMLQERLSNLAIISLEKELAQGIPEAMTNSPRKQTEETNYIIAKPLGKTKTYVIEQYKNIGHTSCSSSYDSLLSKCLPLWNFTSRH